MGFADAAVDLWPVVACRLMIEARPVLYSSHLWIGGTEIEAADPRKRGRCGTHGARLERDV